MSFKELTLKNNYESGIDCLIDDFYIPVLTETVKYDRIAGFFSSSSLVVAAKGIAGLIKNGGKMRIIASPMFSKTDLEALNDVINNPEKYLEGLLLRELENIENRIVKNHISALGWLIANNYLEIKIALVLKKEESIQNSLKIDNFALFHQKVGILEDSDGRIITFSGSINETSAAWLNNVEEFKVFRSWVDGQQEYCKSDQKKFQEFWSNQRRNVRTYNLPKAVREVFLKEISSSREETLRALSLEGKVDPLKNLNLFFYQREALRMWQENSNQLIGEMATGTGKTRVALACMLDLLEKEKRLVVVVATPQNTLSMQWKNEVKKMPRWELHLEGSL